MSLYRKKTLWKFLPINAELFTRTNSVLSAVFNGKTALHLRKSSGAQLAEKFFVEVSISGDLVLREKSNEKLDTWMFENIAA